MGPVLRAGIHSGLADAPSPAASGCALAAGLVCLTMCLFESVCVPTCTYVQSQSV
eukprot:CAMPEP_0181254902 /NCGR_PEP_ID=MMETSP1096-20121128/48856_1 /TAXON_ID=156174 ORGANISM="Chrysochromulina ericina, Strain CCMP281" /NCGR_SAMPLE_ID=MMETSP1096 /ASSEMBLY_ACC=CAM_ASM_000453 /LENGTH=54 /DNA_ID=CAMNT_0023352979 /DNA_START=375 /DNA_END=539 /DNA_ORIENTATION=-